MPSHVRTLVAALSILALSACASLRPAPTGPGSIHATVERATLDPSSSIQMWLRGPDGATDFGFASHDGSRAYEELEPGLYDLAAMICFATDGPWLYTSREVDVRAGTTTETHLALPPDRDARIAIEPEKGSPPFYLVLADEGTELPSDMRELQERLAQRRYPDDLVYASMSDGLSGLRDLPALPAGRYVLLVVANDWQTGDPDPMGRTVDIELRSGEMTVVRLLENLTEIAVD